MNSEKIALKEGSHISGFTVVSARRSEELAGTFYMMTHDASGAQLAWLDNGESNKLFSITFKTLPEDSTGVPHIIEHTVLCGSEKFPVKEPFVDLLKSSMQTFLNAMTFPDKTMYPVSSRNSRDFLNLAEVYLDAVFAPRLLEDENIFRQEGWHIEQEEGEDGPEYSLKGVVFNEMKGAMSDKDEIIRQDLASALFPGNCYRFNYGGDPEHIPELTYEAYKAFYRRCYHPSNARIYLDGSVPIDETLALIDSYLSKAPEGMPTRLSELPEIAPQAPAGGRFEDEYELSPEEDIEDKTQLSISKILCGWEDRLRIFAADIISSALASFNEAPLTRAVLEAGLAQDVEMYVDSGVLQPYTTLIARNVKDGCEEELLALIRKTAADLADRGLDSELLKSYINRYEFQVREGEEPAGLRRAIRCMSSWLYGGDPLSMLEYGDIFKRMRELLGTGWYEEILRDMLVREEGSAVLVTRPSYSRGEELRKAEEDRIAAMTSDWGEAERAENAAMNAELLRWQQTPDDPKDTAKLPVLPLSELGGEISFAETQESEINGVPLIFHPMNTGGIAYINMYFSICDLSLDELKRFGGIAELLADLPTENYSVPELEREIKTRLGSISFRASAMPCREDGSACVPRFAVSLSVLEENIDSAAELVKEILLRTDLSKTSMIKELVMQDHMHAREIAVNAGHVLAASNALSSYGSDGAAGDALSGYSRIRWAAELAENFDQLAGGYASFMEDTLRKAVCRSRLTLSVSCEKLPDMSAFADLPEGEPSPQKAVYTSPIPVRSACAIPAQIGFSAQGADLKSLGAGYSGSLEVAANIATLSYLWNEVRVQGGAYGTGMRINPRGTMYSYSFRDPSPAASIEKNKGIAAFLRAFPASGEDLDKYIISTMAVLEPLVGRRTEAAIADNQYLLGYTREDKQKRRDQMRSTTMDDIIKAADVFEAFAEKGAVSVVAYDGLLDGLEGAEKLPL